MARNMMEEDAHEGVAAGGIDVDGDRVRQRTRHEDGRGGKIAAGGIVGIGPGPRPEKLGGESVHAQQLGWRPQRAVGRRLGRIAGPVEIGLVGEVDEDVAVRMVAVTLGALPNRALEPQRLNTAPRPGETLRNYSARLAAARARDADLPAIEPDERLARAARTSKAPIPPRASFESRPDLVLGDNPTHRRP